MVAVANLLLLLLTRRRRLLMPLLQRHLPLIRQRRLPTRPLQPNRRSSNRLPLLLMRAGRADDGPSGCVWGKRAGDFSKFSVFGDYECL